MRLRGETLTGMSSFHTSGPAFTFILYIDKPSLYACVRASVAGRGWTGVSERLYVAFISVLAYEIRLIRVAW